MQQDPALAADGFLSLAFQSTMAAAAAAVGLDSCLSPFRPLSKYEASEAACHTVYYVPSKRFVARGINNSGFDDEHNRYLTSAGDHIAYRYQIETKLGRGAFGDCWLVYDHKEGKRIALKVIRNEKRFLVQGRVEIQILEALRAEGRGHNCVRLIDSFLFRNHLCLTFDLHSHDLYTELKSRNFAGFSLPDVRSVIGDVLKSLSLLKKKKIVHADLKPENILLAGETGSDVMVIDFGSSCFQHNRIHTYVQSRYYRAPEIVMGLGYGCEVDMWSLGCVMVELITGRPIFAAKTEQDLMLYQMEILGQIPDELLNKATRTPEFFSCDASDNGYKLKKVADRKGRVRLPGTKTLQQSVQVTDPACLDFLRRCFTFDKEKRITPQQALEHPFFTGSGVLSKRKWGSNGSIDSGVDSLSSSDSPGMH